METSEMDNAQAGTAIRRGQRLFVAGSVALLVVAGLHTAGHFSAAPLDPAGESVLDAMRDYQIDVGLGQQPSLLAVQESLSLTMTILLIGIGLINLSIIAIAGEVPGVLRRLTLLGLIIVGGLVVLYGWYRITPPFVTLFAVELLFVASLIVQRSADNATIRTTEASSPSP
jgi:hypothetical protein